MARVIPGCFEIEHNRLSALAQEYELAKEHKREALLHRDARNPDHQRRFQDAQEREAAARERYVAALVSRD